MKLKYRSQIIAFIVFWTQLFTFNADAQIGIKWQNCQGGATTNDELFDLAPSNDGGFLLVGNYIAPNSTVQIIFSKADSLGNQLWTRTYGGSQNDVAQTTFQCSDGGIIFAGLTTSNDGDVSGNHGTYPSSDAWVVKTDSAGVIQWQRPYGGTNDDSFYAGMELANGDLIFAGSTSSSNGDVLGLNFGLTRQIWLMRCNSTGTILNQKLIGGTNVDVAFNIIQTVDGGFAIAGASNGSGNEIDTAYGNWDMTIAKFDSVLNFEWAHVYGGTDVEQAYDLIQTNDGNFVMAGISSSNDIFISGNNGLSDYCVIKTDSIGNFIWQKSLGGSGFEQANTVIEDANGNFIIAGYGGGSTDGDISNPLDGNDAWIACVDSGSTLLWERSLGGGSGDSFSECYRSNDGFIILGGYSGSRDRDVNNQLDPIGFDKDFWLLKIDDQPNSVTGKVFADLDSDLTQDPQEPSVPIHQILDQNSSNRTYSRSTGFYQLDVSGPGTVIAGPAPVDYYTSVPLNHSILFAGFNQVDSLNDFAFQPTGNFNDLQVTLTPVTPLRPGFDVHYHLEYTNTGTTTINGSVAVAFPWELTYLSATTTPDQVTSDSLVWQFTGLAPFQQVSIEINFNVTSAIPIGWNTLSIANIEPLANDFNPINNRDSSSEVVVGSFDPNDISVDIKIINASLSAPFLEYTIRFQNTGNFPASFVRVTNPISSKLDMSTFELMATSHPATYSYIQHSGNMEFFFDNINLVDSTTNEAESHGLIKYRIKPVSPLVSGDTIKNIAYIYFDYNMPVVTNLVSTRIITIVSDNELKQPEFSIYPNPAASSFMIRFNPSTKERTVEVYSALGGNKFSKTISSEEVTINTSSFADGIYFVKVSDGQRSSSRKIIIDHP